MSRKKSVLRVLKYLFLTAMTIFMVIGALKTGYILTQRYKNTITSAYDNLLDNISSKLDSFQNNILDETSNISEN